MYKNDIHGTWPCKWRYEEGQYVAVAKQPWFQKMAFWQLNQLRDWDPVTWIVRNQHSEEPARLQS